MNTYHCSVPTHMWPSVWIRCDKKNCILPEHCQTGWEYVYNTEIQDKVTWLTKKVLHDWQSMLLKAVLRTGFSNLLHDWITWNTIRTTSGLLSCGSYQFHLCLVLGTRAKVCIVMKLLFIWIICKITLSQESTTGHMCNLVFSKNYIIKNETKPVK